MKYPELIIIGNRKTAPFLRRGKVQEANSWRVKLRAPQNIGLDMVRPYMWSTPCENRAAARERKGTLPFRKQRPSVLRRENVPWKVFSFVRGSSIPGKYQTSSQFEYVYPDAQNTCYPIIALSEAPSSKKKNMLSQTRYHTNKCYKVERVIY